MLLKKSLVIIALFALAIASLPAAPALAQTATGRFCVQAQWGAGGAAANVPFVVKDAITAWLWVRS